MCIYICIHICMYLSIFSCKLVFLIEFSLSYELKRNANSA